MTSKRGKRKKYGTRGGTECVAHVPTTFLTCMICLQTHGNKEYFVLCEKKKHNSVDSDVIYVSVL